MKPYNTALRLKEIMVERNLKQVDILNACQPLCLRYNIKIGKSDLSQYISGKVEPGQDKLSVLADALKVSEAWLMGYDVPMQDRSDKIIGERIKIAREASGLTQDEVAKKIGTTRQAVYKYENGIVTNIPLDKLEMIANSLGCSSAWLMGWTEKINGQSIDENRLSEADEKILELFHRVPLDKRAALIEMIEVALKM